MKRLLSMLGFCILVGGCAQVKPDAPSAQQQIQRVLDDMVASANAHDTDRYMARFAHQPTLVFAIDGRIIHGWDALHAQQLKWWRNGNTDVLYTPIGSAEFLTLDENLVATTQALSSRRTSPDGKVLTGTLVVTSIWKKWPQGWAIVYGHESWAH